MHTHSGFLFAFDKQNNKYCKQGDKAEGRDKPRTAAGYNNRGRAVGTADYTYGGRLSPEESLYQSVSSSTSISTQELLSGR